MYNGLQPLIPTPMERDAPDGTTAWSDEVGLPGEPSGKDDGVGTSGAVSACLLKLVIVWVPKFPNDRRFGSGPKTALL